MFDAPNNLSYLLVREWLNGSLFPLSFMLSTILLVFIAENRWRYGAHNWQRQEGVATASTLLWLFSADAWRAWFVWLTYRIINDGGIIPEWLRHASALGFIATAGVLVLAMLRCIYQFSPPRWGHKYWLLSVCVTILFLLVSELAPPFNFHP